MSTSSLPSRVQDFLHLHIDSVEKLEVLLLLRAEPSRSWTGRTVADALRIAEESARGRLTDLCARGLLSCGTEDGYRYGPRSAQDGLAVDELAGEYARRRVSVISFIFSKPSEGVRSFADAFSFRKKGPSDG